MREHQIPYFGFSMSFGDGKYFEWPKNTDISGASAAQHSLLRDMACVVPAIQRKAARRVDCIT